MKTEIFGILEDGREVHIYTLTNESGMVATFTDMGGTWISMEVPDRDGNLADVVLGYERAEHYATNPNSYGAVIGRHANRIGGAAFDLNGKHYELEKNNNQRNNLHSGTDRWYKRIWTVSSSESDNSITFALHSSDMDQGFPGACDVKVTYTLTRNALIIDYDFMPEQDTICNLTNHAYFNLAGHDSGSAMDEEVWIDADYITATDENQITTGQLMPVAGGPFDFTTMKALSKDIEADDEAIKTGLGYDHNFVINNFDGNVKLVAKSYEKKSGRIMEVHTDLPGLQLYTGNCIKDVYKGKGGTTYVPRCAYCFETQFFPNAINIPAFIQPIVKAGVEFKTRTIYKFLTDAN